MVADTPPDISPSAREELEHWSRELSAGAAASEYVHQLLDPSRRRSVFPPPIENPIVPMLREVFGLNGPVRCLELGPGPLSRLAWGVDSGLIEVVGVDILADHYATLRSQHGIEDYPIRAVPGTGETLCEQFDVASFPLVYVSNALDHTNDAPQSFDNLVRVTAPRGLMMFQHLLREGSGSGWSHAHKWDIDVAELGMKATNRQGDEYHLGARDDIELCYLNYRSYGDERTVDVIYRRR